MSQFTDWKRKFVLLIKSEKRLGAKKLFSEYAQKSYTDMQNTIITEAAINWGIYKDESRIKDLTGHLNKVKKEFIGQSELCFYHALLVILLRRDYNTPKIYAEFEQLWEENADFLLKNLSLRWIISGCDSFADFANLYSSNPYRAGIAMNAVTLVNTLKMYETQKMVLAPDLPTQATPQQLEAFVSRGLELYAGLTYFKLGKDDTLKNMRTRYRNFEKYDPLATKIILYVFESIQYLNTAYAFAKALHRDKQGEWWLNAD